MRELGNMAARARLVSPATPGVAVGQATKMSPEDRKSTRLNSRHANISCLLLSAQTKLQRSEEHTSELQSRQYLVCRLLLENNMSNAPEWVMTNSVAFTPRIGDSGLSALFYLDSRLISSFNTGSDLLPQKEQESFWVVNARV